MSKSVSDQNVEDMLSSVRRLVSNELPRNQRSRLPEGPGALVLTEAQRVAPRAPLSAPRGMSLEDRIAELEAAVDSQADDWEPDGSEDQTLNRPDRIVFRPSRPLTEEEQRRPLRLSEIALIETGPANEIDAEDTEAHSSEDASEVSFRHEGAAEEGSDEVAAGDQDVPRAAPDFKPESGPRFDEDPFADAVARDVAAVVAEMAEAALTRQVDFDSALAEAVEAAGASEKPHEDGPADTSTETDEGEGLISEETRVDPDEQVLARRQEVEGVGEARSAVPAPPTPADARPTSMTREDRARVLNDGIAIDSEQADALRPLISAMIREELQGELGERITRNVRKLVRQEVNRALSVRELE